VCGLRARPFVFRPFPFLESYFSSFVFTCFNQVSGKCNLCIVSVVHDKQSKSLNLTLAFAQKKSKNILQLQPVKGELDIPFGWKLRLINMNQSCNGEHGCKRGRLFKDNNVKFVKCFIIKKKYSTRNDWRLEGIKAKTEKDSKIFSFYGWSLYCFPKLR